MGILLAVLSIQDYATRDLPDRISSGLNTATVSSEKPAESSSSMDEMLASKHPDLVVRNAGLFDHWSLPSIGLGGLIFSLHRFLTDSGTLIAYSWTGYPVTGPFPGFHGYLTLMAMAIGIFISSSGLKNLLYHPVWMTIGAVSTYLMYQWHDWPGYIASLCLTVFLSSIVPVIIELASFHGRHTPGKVYFTAWSVVALLVLADVWTVAYAFVPAGWLLRERTDM